LAAQQARDRAEEVLPAPHEAHELDRHHQERHRDPHHHDPARHVERAHVALAPMKSEIATPKPYQAITRHTEMHARPMKRMSQRRAAGPMCISRISTKMWPFSRTSHGAPMQGTTRSAYSVKLKKCAELWKPKLRSTTSSVMITIMATIRNAATYAMPYSTAL